MSTATSLMTFAEFEQLPGMEGYKRELVDGEVITMPPPDLKHARVRDRIHLFLADRLDRKHVHRDYTGYRIAGGWLEPDVGVSWPDQRDDEKYFIGSPMIAVEILSQGEDINREVTLYLEDSASEVWVFDHRKKTMAAYAKRREDIVWINVEREYIPKRSA